MLLLGTAGLLRPGVSQAGEGPLGWGEGVLLAGELTPGAEHWEGASGSSGSDSTLGQRYTRRPAWAQHPLVQITRIVWACELGGWGK